MERILRGMGGTVVLASLLLAWSAGTFDLTQVSWLWLAAFAGLNMLQSAFTDWCPAMWILERLGIQRMGAKRVAS